MSSQVVYPASTRKAMLFLAFILLWAWICYRSADRTYDEIAQKLCLAGAAFFALVALFFLIQLIRGVPRLTLTEKGFSAVTGFSGGISPWAEYYNFSVGHSFGPIETISFIRRGTGADGAVINLTDIPGAVLCDTLNEWQQRYSHIAPRSSADCT